MSKPATKHARRRFRGLVAAGLAAFLGAAMLSPSSATLPANAAERPWTNPRLSPDARALALLEQMTLEEKVELMTGDQGEAPSAFYNAPIERLGIPELRMADAGGGIAARGWTLPGTGDTATAFPAGAALGATWNPRLARRYGRAVADEAKATGHAMLLGPGSDMGRQPFWGRIAEGMSEDPLLTSELTTPYVAAVQRQNVIANLKHYAGYTQEVDRGNAQDSIIDPRALREVYTAPYADAIEKADLGSVMCSFNEVNSVFACENDLLLDTILRDELGFTGFVITDFGAIHSTEPSIRAGTDMETGTAAFYDGALLAAVQDGTVPEALVDRSVLRILRTMFAIGVFDHDYTMSAIPVAAHGRLARTVEDEAVTLLKNDGTLPLRRRVRSAVVIGADANVTGRLGGSFAVQPTYQVSLVDAMRDLGRRTGLRVRYAPGNDTVNGASMIETADMTAVPSTVLTPESGSGNGLTARHYGNTTFSGDPVTRTEAQVLYDTGFTSGVPAFASLYSSQVPPVPDVSGTGVAAGQSVTYTGTLTAPATGDYRLGLTGWGDAKAFLDGEQIIDMTGADGRRAVEATVSLTRGQSYDLRIEYAATHPLVALQPGTLLLQWSPPRQAVSPRIAQAVRAARRADVAVVYARTYESEERDRVSLKLPQSADRLISAVAAVNPRTVVVLSSGGPVTMPWRNQVEAVVQSYPGGQEEGSSLVRVLSGAVNPSGRLPMTYPVSEQQLPPGISNPWDSIGDTRVEFSEGVNIGYRGYLASGTRMLYPFGYGLSYTTFAHRRLQTGTLRAAGTREQTTVRVRVRNTGRRTGAEVVQVYAGRLPGLDAPARKLVGFAKVTLRPGRAAWVRVPVSRRSLSYWNDATSSWVTPRGRVPILVGTSARDIALRGTITVR
ncbi:glycoside hydrolase family 3 protein [Mumia sp. DW29H23]|uniref:glycoside hydrolase family 3 protein n=1 Tax=Mumia sp. DW29H23 TaxID=3421241 RepID=UPI003D68D475